MHIREGAPLPATFKQFVEGAKHGVILFSLGYTGASPLLVLAFINNDEYFLNPRFRAARRTRNGRNLLRKRLLPNKTAGHHEIRLEPDWQDPP